MSRQRQAYRRGRLSEAICRLVLRLKGYRILARGYRAPVGEIDIIARRGRVLVLVEVKARDRLDAAAEALAPRQKRRIQRAAEHFLQREPALAGLGLRFDVMLVRHWRLPRHLKGAWRLEDGY
jgi:putative endonuclease